MDEYRGLKVFYGDLHNHCDISYGHGPLEAALDNARMHLDFCSITGHAAWPDMPDPDQRIDYILDFHKKGFTKLAGLWPDMIRVLEAKNQPGEFIIFPGYEVHSNLDGDHTFLIKSLAAELILGESIPDTIARLRQKYGKDALGFPHHIGYPQGHRGINWHTYDTNFCPLVEMYSMHGCAEGEENHFPYLHSMGPADVKSSMQFGLSQGYKFGVLANTDHHSGFPGSYGHGRTAVWAAELSREALWDALRNCRTYALTGDRIELAFSVNGKLMGQQVPDADHRQIEIDVCGGSAINHVDLIKNNRLLKRFVPADNTHNPTRSTVHSKLYFEVGWGERNKIYDWEVDLSITNGKILSVEPRFRGMEVLSPVKMPENQLPFRNGSWKQLNETQVHFRVSSQANPTSSTSATQGICIEIECQETSQIKAQVNQTSLILPIKRLLEGSYGRPLGSIDSPAFLFHRLPQEKEFQWSLTMKDIKTQEHDFYYVRVIQDNGQMAWSSPIFV